jgi:ferredoxin-NADP reductase
MIGAGIGITPIRALLESTPFAPGHATVILRGHSEKELYLGKEIMDLCQRRGATLYHLTGRRPAGVEAWLPADATRSGYRLGSYVPNITDADVYVCGPASWAQNVLKDARAAGVRNEQLHYERFDW